MSPFLLLLLLTSALSNENQAPHSQALLSLESLDKLDTGTADALRPWMVLKETDQLSGFTGGWTPQLLPIQNLLAQCGEYQVRLSSQFFPCATLMYLNPVEHCEHEPM